MTTPELLALYESHDLRLLFWERGVDKDDFKGPNGPKNKGWNAKDKVYDLSKFDPTIHNLGVFTGHEGAPGRFLVDVDLDWDEGIDLAKMLLPPTGFGFGRESRPLSHAFYLSPVSLPSFAFKDIDNKRTFIELRAGDSTHQTMLPPSIHPSGETIELKAHEPPTLVEDMPRYARRHAVACIVHCHLPGGFHHDARLALCGTLLRLDVLPEDVNEIGLALCRVQGTDAADWRTVFASTVERLAKKGSKVSGAGVLAKLIGEHGKAVINRIKVWMGPDATSVADDGTSIIINEPTTAMVDRAWEHLTSANNPPGIFKRQDEVVILRNSASTCLDQLYGEQLKLNEPTALQHVPGFRSIDTDTFREIVGRMVPCVQINAKGGARRNVYPSREFANLMLASPALPLPEPLGFTPVPFFTPEGDLITTPGLHRATGMFYQPPPGFSLPEIPEHPSSADVAKAIGVLDEMVWQFPFKGREGQHPYHDVREGCDWRKTAAYANMLAFPLTVLTRSLFHAVPLFLFDKPTTRTGASLLVQCWSYILTGAWPSEAEWDGNESERRKFLTAILITGAPIIFLDEVKDLKSPDLNKILTGKGARIGRVLGKSEITNPRNFSTFVATGNNPAFPRDMAGRMCRVRLDADMVKPSDRTTWDKDLMRWVPENRAALLTALYVLVRAWFATGRPPNPEDRVLNGFEPWSFTIGGILHHAKLTEFLANKKDVEDDAEEEEADDVDALLESWANAYPDQKVTTATILALDGLPSVDGVDWNARNLGNWLRVNRDKRRLLSSGYEIRIVRGKGEGRWQLNVLKEPEPGSEPKTAEAGSGDEGKLGY